MLDRETITSALGRLAEHLKAAGVQGEICLLEGTEILGDTLEQDPQ